MKNLKLFETHQQYEAAESSLILPNVSFCLDTPNVVHYKPRRCEEKSIYEVVGTPSYPATVDGADTSFDITVNYIRTDTDTACTDTVTEGTDTVTVEIGANPSASGSRTVTGTVDYYGNEIEYSVIQSKFEAKVTAKFNVTDASNPTPIGYRQYISGFSAIEIDGVEQPSVVSAYTFSTTGEHTIKYVLANPTTIGNNAFGGCTSLTSIDIPDSVASIGSNAFNGCSGLTSIDIHDSVTSIGESAFINCSSLTTATIGSGVTTIGGSAFRNCSGLTSIDIPDNVTSIGASAFGGCRSLTNCTIGSGVTSIGSEAFAYCRSLSSITCSRTTAPTIQTMSFRDIKTGGTLYVPIGSSGYDTWMGTGSYYLGKYNWTKVEQ